MPAQLSKADDKKQHADLFNDLCDKINLQMESKVQIAFELSIRT